MAEPKKARKSYAQLNNELESIIDWFESSEINIDEALPKYEKAMELIGDMERSLKDAENKIKKINARYRQ